MNGKFALFQGNPRDQTSTWQPAPFPSGVLYSEDRTQSMPSLVTSELETKSRDEFRREKGDIQMKKPTEQVEKKNQKIKEAKLLQESKLCNIRFSHISKYERCA